MLFINATLSKNQMYKLKNQINKVPTISKQDDIEFFSKYFCTSFSWCHVYNVLSCYHNRRIFICRYQGVMLRNNDMLFWEFFLNFSAIIETKVMIIRLIKSKFLLKQFLIRINMRWVLFHIVILEFRIPVHSNCVSKFH